MKRSIIFAVLLLLVLAVSAAITLQANTHSKPYLVLCALEARINHGVYKITISPVGEKQKSIHFSAEREVLKVNGISPLTVETIQGFIGMRMDDIIAQHGSPHADIGSGLFIPAYITEDAYIVSLRVGSDGIVKEIYVEDLLQKG